MKKTLVTASCLLALSASVAMAQPSGVNLSWNDCGTFGSAFQFFDCASNSGTPFTAVSSYWPPAGIDSLVGISSQMDITTDSATLPDWWKHGTGQCRTTAGLSVAFDFTSGPFSCVDFWQGQAAGGFAYDIGFGSPNRARLRVQCAVPFENKAAVHAGTEYYCYKVNLLRAKSFGTGACVGGHVPACLVLNNIQLFQPPEMLNDPDLSGAVNQNYVTWQTPTVPGCPASTPTRNSSWGQVKSLYR